MHERHSCQHVSEILHFFEKFNWYLLLWILYLLTFFSFPFQFQYFSPPKLFIVLFTFFYLSNGTQPRIFGPIFKLAHQTSKFIMRQKSYTYKWISHILQEKPWFVDGKKIVQILRDVSVMFGLSACSRYPINLSPAECWSCFQK